MRKREVIVTPTNARRLLVAAIANAAVRGHPEFHSDNVHFNGQGTQTLAAQVCAAAEKLLPR